jgi:autotransporter-associated beta strand protein
LSSNLTLQPNGPGGYLDVSSSSGNVNPTLTFNNNGNLGVSGTGNATLTLTGNASGVIQSIFVDGSRGSTSVTKDGTGNWTLQNNQLYSGNTTVVNGTLYINGNLVNSNVNANGGTLTNVANTDVINKTVYLNTGGTLTPTLGQIGNININTLAYNGGTLNIAVNATGTQTFNFNVGGNTSMVAGDLVNITNNLNLTSGGYFNFLNVANLTPYNQTGNIALFDLSPGATITGPLGNISWAGLQVGFSAVLNKIALSAGAGNLVVAQISFLPTRGYFTDTANSTVNWSNSASWYNNAPASGVGNLAVFPAIQSQSVNVTVDSPFTVGGLIFSGVNSYDVNGTSNLTINNGTGIAGNIYTQGGSHTVSAPLILTANAGLNITTLTGTQMNLLSNISQTGAGVNANVTIGGGGTTEMFGNNTYTGVTTLQSGTVVANNANSFGIGGNLVLAANSVLSWDP